MSVTPNRDGLKAISEFSIDSQWLLKNHLGEKIFNYQGEITSDFQKDCAELLQIATDAKTDLDKIIAQIPIGK